MTPCRAHPGSAGSGAWAPVTSQLLAGGACEGAGSHTAFRVGPPPGPVGRMLPAPVHASHDVCPRSGAWVAASRPEGAPLDGIASAACSSFDAGQRSKSYRALGTGDPGQPNPCKPAENPTGSSGSDRRVGVRAAQMSCKEGEEGNEGLHACGFPHVQLGWRGGLHAALPACSPSPGHKLANWRG